MVQKVGFFGILACASVSYYFEVVYNIPAVRKQP